ncbi:MAG TPA: hypothetical protein GX711_09295, partial [Clostridia bacterium]|nr:hypothetical protein [Clostridia bacterium]
MGISLAEVLDILELDIGAVKAGRNAMDNLVVRVNVLEAPDAIKWLAGNELLLTTGYALQGDPNFHRDFLQQLAAKGIAGLGIKAGRYLDPIPPEMIQEGNRLGFPIIELPAYLPLSQVITPVYEVLLNQQVSRLKRSQEIHAKFLEIVFRGNGFESICSTLTGLIDKPVFIVDARHQVLAHSGEDFLSPLEVADLKKDLEGIDLKYDEISAPKTYETYEFIPIEARIQNETRQVAFFPIIGGNHVWGAIIVLDVAKDIDFQSITACEHAATIAALEFAKQDSIFRANLTSESQLLEDIIEGNFSSLQSVQRRLGYFGFKLQGNLRAMVLDIIDFESYYLQEAKKGEKHFQKVKDEIYRETKAMFHGFPGSFLGGMKSDSVIAIASLKDEEAENRFRLIVRKLSSALQKKFPQIDISFGIGRPCFDLTGVHQS